VSNLILAMRSKATLFFGGRLEILGKAPIAIEPGQRSLDHAASLEKLKTAGRRHFRTDPISNALSPLTGRWVAALASMT